MDKGIKITLIIVAAVLVIFGISAYMFYTTNVVQGQTISVQGDSTIQASPDLLTVYFNVETNGTTSKEASDENARIVEDVITALVKKGFARADIQTLNYNIYPWQEWQDNSYVNKGFKASHQIKIELKETQFSLAGDVIDAGASAGALVNSINFELSDSKQAEYKKQALTLAGQDARSKADGIAAGVGKQVGDLVSVSTNDFNYSPRVLYATANAGASDLVAAKEVATNISPSTQEVSGSVTVVYKLK